VISQVREAVLRQAYEKGPLAREIGTMQGAIDENQRWLGLTCPPPPKSEPCLMLGMGEC